MVKDYEVIIVGAGPGGLACAGELVHSGMSVLLIEKKSEIGPKICAGGLTRQAASFDIPEEKTWSSAIQTVYLQNKQYTIHLLHPLKTISRHDLGQFLLRKLTNAETVTIMKEAFVHAIEGNSVRTNKGDFRFRYLVGADGSQSIVRRNLGLKSEICVGLFYEIREVGDRFIWHLDPGRLKAGYLWVIPHKDHTNIGVYFNPKHLLSRQAAQYLNNYMISNNYAFSNHDLRAAPINHFYQGCVFDNIFLVGDAAGLASKATGEGISYALISGREIGKKILDPGYKLDGLDRIVTIKKRQESFLSILERYSSSRVFFQKTFLFFMKRHWFQTFYGH